MHPSLLFVGFFLYAVAFNLLGPLATNIMATTGLSLSNSGVILSFQQFGSLVSIGATLLIMKRLKQTSVMRIGYLFVIVALMAIAFFSSGITLFLFYFILGIGNFLTDSGSNATLASKYYEKRALYIPLLHFCYSAGAIATGYLILPFKGKSWPWAYGVVGISLAGILLLGLYQQWSKNSQSTATSLEHTVKIPEVQAGPVLPLVKDAAFVLYTLVILFYMGNQVVCAAWIPVFVETELGQPPAIVGTSLTVFWGGIALARLLIGPIMQKGGKPFLLSIGGMILAGISLVALTQTDSIVLVLLWTALCGFFAGATIPMYIVVTTTWFPKNTAFISLSYLFGGAVGRMIFPWLVTKIASFTSLSFSLMLSSSMLFVSAILIFIVRKITKLRPVLV